jgi:hypothetical protein
MRAVERHPDFVMRSVRRWRRTLSGRRVTVPPPRSLAPRRLAVTAHRARPSRPSRHRTLVTVHLLPSRRARALRTRSRARLAVSAGRVAAGPSVTTAGVEVCSVRASMGGAAAGGCGGPSARGVRP